MKFLNIVRGSSHGQAVIEYLFLFGLMALISIGMVKGFGNAMGVSVSKLGYVLSQQLSIGTCERHCFGTGYKNNVGN